MGITGTFVFVEWSGTTEIAAAIAELADLPIVSRDVLTADAWLADRNLFGYAIAPVSGWCSVAASDRSVDHVLLEVLAARLRVRVVVSSLYDICDPPEPEHVIAYGGAPEYGLIEMLGPTRYPASEALFVTLRDRVAREHSSWEPSADTGDDIPF